MRGISVDRQTTTNETEYPWPMSAMRPYCRTCLRNEADPTEYGSPCNMTGAPSAEQCIDLFISTLISPWYNEDLDNELSILKDIPFHVVSMKDGKMLEMDEDTGKLGVGDPSGEDNQMWTFLPNEWDQQGEAYLFNLGGYEYPEGTYSPWVDVVYHNYEYLEEYNTKTLMVRKIGDEYNGWGYDSYAFNSKRKGGSIKYQPLQYMNDGWTPWTRFQWQMVRADSDMGITTMG